MFRKLNQNEHRMSLLSSTIKSEQESKKMTIINGEQKHIFQRFDESDMSPVVLAEYRQLQHELQCQEALLVLMQKLKTNQKFISQTNTNNGLKQRTTTTAAAAAPTTATKLSQQSSSADGKTPLTATKQSLVNEQFFLSGKKSTKFSLSRIIIIIIIIDRYQQSHRIPINILLIVQIIILSNNHRKILCRHHHLRLFVSQIIILITHYQQQLHEYHQQCQQLQRRIRLLSHRQAIHQKVRIFK